MSLNFSARDGLFPMEIRQFTEKLLEVSPKKTGEAP